MEQITTLIRIKRPLVNDSAENIIVSAKRRCLDKEQASSDDSQSDTVLKRLCTIQTQDEPFEDVLKKALLKNRKVSTYAELKDKFKSVILESPKDKCRELVKASSSENRYKLVCSKRHMETSSEPLQDHNLIPKFNVYDAFREIDTGVPFNDAITCNGIPMRAEKQNYVYDLYFTSVPLEYQSLTDNIFEIQHFTNTPMLLHEEAESDNEKYDDEDDENEEGNWRNDYPEDESSEEEDYDSDYYLSNCMRQAKLSDSDESGSDYDDMLHLKPSDSNENEDDCNDMDHIELDDSIE